MKFKTKPKHDYGKYNIIDSQEKLLKLDSYLMDGDKPRFDLQAYDTETNGLDLYKSVVIGFSFSTDSNSGFYVPLLYWVPDPKSEKLKSIDKVKRKIFEHGHLQCAWTGKIYDEFVTPKDYQPPEFIKKYAKRWFSKVNLIMHNAPFDVNMTLINLEIDLTDNVLLDTALLAHILNENSLNGLKHVAAEWSKELGFNPYVDAANEQKELGETVIRNGGTFNARTKHVWRADAWPLGKYACFKEKSAKVSLSNGSSKYIEDVKIGDEVITHKGRSRKVYSINKRKFKGDIFSFTIEGGRSIKNVTGEHPFLILNERTLKQEWVKAKDLKPNHLVVKGHVKKSKNKGSFRLNSFWWFFGLYQADGYVRVQKNNYYPVITLHEKEVSYLTSYLDNNEQKYSLIKKQKSKGIDIVIYNSLLGKDLIKLSGGKFKSYDKQISKEAFQYLVNNKEAALSFIAGVYDGDGHFRKMKNRKFSFQLDLTVTSQSLINTIDLLFSSHEINCYRGDCKSTKGRKHRYNLLLTKNPASILNSYMRIKNREDLPTQETSFSKYMRIIKKKKIVEECEVYNISVEEDETYISNGLVTHNCADTFLTFGLYEVGMAKFIEEFGEKGLEWLFEDEVMPVCKEVVIPMKRRGVYIDVPYFTQLKIDTQKKLEDLEDEIIGIIEPYLDDFTIGDSIDEAISKGRIIKRIMQLEGLSAPKKYDKKSDTWKETLSKPVVKKLYQKEPHWLWGYVLGEDEIKYSDAKMQRIKAELYQEVIGRRYRFNISSDNHLRWLFCDKLGMDKTKLPQTDSATKENPIPSMAAEVLDTFMVPKFEWVRKLMLYKKISKLQGTYIKPAVELNLDGWLYMDMKQNGTLSGRFACSGGFNLQTLPKVEEIDKCSKCDSKKITITHPMTLLATVECKDCGHVDHDILCSSAIKKGFIAPPGYKIVNADYSSLEPRCFAYVSGDKKLKQVYWDNLDLYSKVYCDMMKEPYVDLKEAGRKKERDLVKPVILGIPYGARDPQVANLMGLKKKKKFRNRDTKKLEEREVLDVDKGKEYRTLYLGTYKKLHKYMMKQELDCISKGYVTTLVGRRRHFQYAPFIYEILSCYSITVDEFLDARWTEMQKYDVKSLGLDKEGLQIICKKFKLDFAEVMEKGAWSYVRELFKNEYNGSKNYPIQGLAGHICNMGMRDTTRLFKKNKIDAWIFLQVHDEVSSYVKENQTEMAVKLQKKGMEDNKYAKMIDIPMIADPIVCDNLKDSK